jgi:hypothetical protein
VPLYRYIKTLMVHNFLASARSLLRQTQLIAALGKAVACSSAKILSLALLCIFIVLLWPFRDLKRDLFVQIPLSVIRRNVVLATIPQILDGQLARTSQALNVADPIKGGF